jgi:hypothetical protein
MLSDNEIIVALATIVVFGVGAQWVGRLLGFPSLLLPAGLHWGAPGRRSGGSRHLFGGGQASGGEAVLRVVAALLGRGTRFRMGIAISAPGQGLRTVARDRGGVSLRCVRLSLPSASNRRPRHEFITASSRLRRLGVSVLLISTRSPDDVQAEVDTSGVPAVSLADTEARIENAVQEADVGQVAVCAPYSIGMNLVDAALVEILGRRRVLRLPGRQAGTVSRRIF